MEGISFSGEIAQPYCLHIVYLAQAKPEKRLAVQWFFNMDRLLAKHKVDGSKPFTRSRNP
jgi:hypothetical protein